MMGLNVVRGTFAPVAACQVGSVSQEPPDAGISDAGVSLEGSVGRDPQVHTAHRVQFGALNRLRVRGSSVCCSDGVESAAVDLNGCVSLQCRHCRCRPGRRECWYRGDVVTQMGGLDGRSQVVLATGLNNRSGIAADHNPVESTT
jgi:hypothetical protein